MAITQISKIQVRSGSTDDIPQLSLGELGWAYYGSNSPQLVIGGDGSNASGITPDNIEVLTQVSANIPAKGSPTQVQFNNDGLLDGIPTVTWDGANINLGDIDSVKIAGGTNGYVLATDGQGNLSWTVQSGGGGGNGTPGGANTQVQFNDAGSFGANADFTFNSSTGVLSAPAFTGTLTTAAQPNITSVGTLTSLRSNGTVNFTTASNVSLGPVDNVRITGGTAGYFLKTDGSGTLSWDVPSSTYGNANVAGFLAAYGSNTIVTTGNVTVGNIIGNGQALTGLNGANVTGTVPRATVAASANAVAGANVSGAVAFATTANSVAGANVSGTVANATFATTSGSTNSVAGANVSGAVAFATTANSVAGANVSGTVASANTAATVTTAAQPNITSTGTLTSLTVSGTTNLGAVGNVRITGGTSGQVLTTNGSNVLSWTTVATGGGAIAITNDNTTDGTFYPTFTNATGGNITSETVSSTKLTFNPSSGLLSATNFNSLSDINYKTNLAKIENALGAVSNINGYTFDWLDGSGSDTGVIAQEIEQNIPNAVTEIDGRKTVKYSAITAYLLEAIKELKQEIDILKAERK